MEPQFKPIAHSKARFLFLLLLTYLYIGSTHFLVNAECYVVLLFCFLKYSNVSYATSHLILLLDENFSSVKSGKYFQGFGFVNRSQMGFKDTYFGEIYYLNYYYKQVII